MTGVALPAPSGPDSPNRSPRPTSGFTSPRATEAHRQRSAISGGLGERPWACSLATSGGPRPGPGRPGLEGGEVAAAAERGAHRDAHVRDGRHARLTKRFLHREDGELLGVVPQRLTLD